jgi:hypothetical protein
MNEITIKEIKKDLSDIRYYYSRKKALDEAFRNIGYNERFPKVCFAESVCL